MMSWIPKDYLWLWHYVCRWIRSQSHHATWISCSTLCALRVRLHSLVGSTASWLLPLFTAQLLAQSSSMSTPALPKGTLTTRLQRTVATHGRHIASPTNSRMSWWLVGYGSFKLSGYPMNLSVSVGNTRRSAPKLYKVLDVVRHLLIPPCVKHLRWCDWE